MKLFITVFFILLFSLSLFAQDQIQVKTKEQLQIREREKLQICDQIQTKLQLHRDKFVDLDGDGINDNFQGHGLKPFNKHNFRHKHQNQINTKTQNQPKNQTKNRTGQK